MRHLNTSNVVDAINDQLLSENLYRPEYADANLILNDEETWYESMDRAYEDAHVCRYCTSGWCPHCQS
jgi:hypothetical protein